MMIKLNNTKTKYGMWKKIKIKNKKGAFHVTKWKIVIK